MSVLKPAKPDYTIDGEERARRSATPFREAVRMHLESVIQASKISPNSQFADIMLRQLAAEAAMLLAREEMR